MIRTFTNPGDLVLDNACGSGSFVVAAAAEGRRFCGIEKNADVHLFKKDAIDYIALSETRLLAAIGSAPGKTNSPKTGIKVYRQED